jgi:hypothetical protein
MARLPLLVLAPLALLAACNGSGSDDARAPSGEVLEGSISDAMLPLDTVRSEPPLEDPAAAAAAQASADANAPAPSADSGESERAGESDATAPEPAADAPPAEAAEPAAD